jgi:hypothetical protein
MYVCGDINVGVSLRDALVKIAQTHGNIGTFKANVCGKGMEKEGEKVND